MGRLSVEVAPERAISDVAAVAKLAAAAVFLARTGRGAFFWGGTDGGSSAGNGGVSVVNSSGATDFLVGDLAMREGNYAQKLAARIGEMRRVKALP